MQKTKKLFPIGITAIVVVLMAAMMVLAAGTARAGDINVDADASDPDCVVGSGQGNPYSAVYCSIQDAIDDAVSGDTVLVAPGTYIESIQMKSGVAIQGSGADVTTIQGDGSPVSVPNTGTRTYTVLGKSGSTISGFTITGSDYGIYNFEYSSPTITNNIITGNYDSAIYNFWFSSPTITNNTISGNTGDGIYNDFFSSPTITNNIITGNGVGIWNEFYSSPTITNNTISWNGEGIQNFQATNSAIYYNNFIYNSSIPQASDTSGTYNTWDDENSGGNYWSDYTGQDSDSDGIGDTPYAIAGGSGSKDNYPFMNENGWATPNQAPVANDQSVTTAQDTPVAITLTASDLDGDELSYTVVSQPTHGILGGTAPDLTYTPIGDYNGSDSFTFKANDGEVDSNTATVTITITSANAAPVADAGPDQTVEQESDYGTEVTLDGSSSTDSDSTPGTNDDIVSFDWHEGNTSLGSDEIMNYTFPLGTHTITLVVTDSFDETDEDHVVINVQDTTAPNVAISASPEILWPPNNKMRDILIQGEATDLSGELYLEFLVEDEYGECEPSLSDFGEIIQLEASRRGNDKDGRVYTISVTATDASGNSDLATTNVVVPHDQGKGKK